MIRIEISKYRNAQDVSRYDIAILAYWYFCSVQFMQLTNEGILLTSFIERFSLFLTNAMLITVSTAACKYIWLPTQLIKIFF